MHAAMIKSAPVASTSRPFSAAVGARRPVRGYRLSNRHVVCSSHKVEIMQDGTTTVLDVPDGTSILEAALDKGLDLPHDCKMGVCMTCPARVVSGRIDQSVGMLSEDVQEKGYALLCVAVPQEDCTIQIIEEEELLNEVMV